MDELSVRLSLLIEITTKKKNLLDLIQNITYNQNCIASNELDYASRQLFLELSNEKQKGIDEIYNLDTVFQRTYDTIKDSFNPTISNDNKQKVKALQSIIDEVVQIDKNICELESINSALLEHKKNIIEQKTNQTPNNQKLHMNKAIEQYNIQNNNYSKHKLFGGNQ